MTTRILVADDEPAIRESLTYALEREGFDVTGVENGDAALSEGRTGSYDLVILDVMMPGQSGMDVCRALRSESDVPIVMLTAKDAEVDRVLGLELGADDYVTKPFSVAEMLSRVRAILRRRELDRSAAGSLTRVIGDLRIDLARHEVAIADAAVHLTPSEFKVLALLAEEPGRVFSRRQIMEHLWASIYVGDERACDVHISSLRRKIEENASNPQRIMTVRGVGYKLATQ